MRICSLLFPFCSYSAAADSNHATATYTFSHFSLSFPPLCFLTHTRKLVTKLCATQQLRYRQNFQSHTTGRAKERTDTTNTSLPSFTFPFGSHRSSSITSSPPLLFQQSAQDISNNSTRWVSSNSIAPFNYRQQIRFTGENDIEQEILVIFESDNLWKAFAIGVGADDNHMHFCVLTAFLLQHVNPNSNLWEILAAESNRASNSHKAIRIQLPEKSLFTICDFHFDTDSHFNLPVEVNVTSADSGCSRLSCCFQTIRQLLYTILRAATRSATISEMMLSPADNSCLYNWWDMCFL
jgi:hypothetical protein